MARKNYGKTRAKSKKVSYAKAKRTMEKVNKKKKAKNMDTFSLTVKTSALMVPVQGVTVSNYVYTTVPLMNSTLYTGVTQNSEFILYRNMYDQVRINSVMVKVTPKANVLDQVYSQDNSLTTTGDGLFHTIIDRDAPGATSIQAWSKYPSYRKFNQKKSFSRKYNISWPKGIWLDTANLYDDMSLLKQVGALGGIYLYAENVLEDVGELINQPLADIHIYYNVVYRGKTAGALSYDFETGGISVRPNDTLPLLTPTPFVNVRGSINDTILTQIDTGEVFDISANDLTQAV